MRLGKFFLHATSLAVLLFASVALAIPAGTIVITETQMDPKSPTFEKDLKKAQTSTLTKQGAGWRLYFVAYLKKPAGAKEVNIVFYDVTGGKKQEATAYPVGTQPNAKIIMSDLELSEEQNFQAGHKYDVRITRLVGGKEDVYARTTLQLK